MGAVKQGDVTLEERTLVHAGEEWSSELFRIATSQLAKAAAVLGMDDEERAQLENPRRALTVNFPVRMDDGRVQMFIGYRVQHCLHMGPTKGGFRYAPEVSMGECAALAMWMSWKCALLGLPYGGAKGGVRCDPHELSVGEIERAWFMDTYSQQVGHAVPEIVTGKPPVLGGTEARRPATGLGVVYVIEGVLERLRKPIREQRCVVQGFGNVGATAAEELHAIGAKVVGASDVRGGIVNPDGLDIPALLR